MVLFIFVILSFCKDTSIHLNRSNDKEYHSNILEVNVFVEHTEQR